ncbi:reverse transcriptase [Gossypium australe]|uniref:Reverse transcriptase n=1 Tax=Gossypium australe TaxID=47621 RepID=A0A5B6X4U3_9ROSI|nr:reverse transcriptase [Gossypium australe]
MVGRDKKRSFQNLKDRMISKVRGWSARFLSIGVKEVFIKNNIPTYTMACFLLPKSLCKELENIMSQFWWQKNHEKCGIHWCEWSKLGELKRGMGNGISMSFKGAYHHIPDKAFGRQKDFLIKEWAGELGWELKFRSGMMHGFQARLTTRFNFQKAPKVMC